MKTPLPSGAHFRAFLFAVGILLLAGSPVRAQISLQLPISRASHSFTLWQWASWSASPPGSEWKEGWPTLGWGAGYYIPHDVINLGLIGGSFDSNGVWLPGSEAALSVWVGGFNQGPSFIVVDNTTGEVTQPNQIALTQASWFSPTGEMEAKFFAIPADRVDHVFALEAIGDNYGAPGGGTSWGGWFPVSNGQVQVWTENGATLSLGYFEAWAFTPPGGFVFWRLYDVTSDEASSDGLSWTGAFGTGPVAEMRMRVADAGQVFTVYGASGATQQVTSQWDTVEGANTITASVGINQEFYVRRDWDGRESMHYTVPWGGMVVDEVANFTGTGPVTDFQTLTFYATSPTGMFVKRTADNAPEPLTIEWWNDMGFYANDPSGTQSVWVSRYPCSAYVDVVGGWTVIDGNAVDRGQGPEFIDWPAFATVLTEVAIPLGRSGHVLKTSFGESLSYVGPCGAYSVGNYWIELERYVVPIPEAYATNGGTITINDETVGDSSPSIYVTPGVQYLNFMPDWHTTSPVLLKISATRWNNDLRIRCANGSEFPITRHQVQGDWSWAGNGSWFNSYGYFDAGALCLAGMGWELYDATRAVTIGSSGSSGTDFSWLVDDTDTDGDTLPDWYERMIGTNPNNANTDGDDQGDDAWELIHGTNPRAVLVTAGSNTTLNVFTPLE